MGFEPMTSSLPRKCSTPELRRLILISDIGFTISDLSAAYPFLIFCAKSEFKNPKSDIFTERKTRFELATYSLEGYRSTN